jgi:hypothetical protein
MPKERESVEEVVYISKSRMYAIGNWRPEEKYPNGSIKQNAECIEFSDWGFVTDDPEKQKFIEKTNDFKIGDVRRASHPELERYRLARMPLMKEIVNSGQSVEAESIGLPENVM